MKCLMMLSMLALVTGIGGSGYAQADEPAASPKGEWVNISDTVINGLTAAGKKVGYPGQTAGITVDRVTGDVYMVVPDQGLWKSSDRGDTFTRIDGGKIGGRCETGFGLNFDPEGERLACFMLDGPGAYTLDNGKTWQSFTGYQRGWDAASVDWSAKNPRDIFAMHHESGGEILISHDMGKSWKLIGKGITAVGILDANTLVSTKDREKGIFYSADDGATWEKTSDLQPAGRAIRVFKGVAYWTSAQGLLISKDKGKTWSVQGQSVDCSFGPFFGKDEKQIVVVGKNGFHETTDAGETWQQVAPLPPQYKVDQPGWFLNFGWDPNADIFYASRMTQPAYKFQRGK